ncbi:MAG: sortase [Candidatus Levybacteria bacterium]|nr:sortase [Candidatus Levybacteria bacterium]
MLKNEIILQIFCICITALLIALFIARIYPSGLFKQYSKAATAQASNKLAAKIISKITPIPSIIVSPPISISIQSIKMDLAVAPGVIINDEWTLFDDKVSWLATSKMPGLGNVILYGHNRKGLFGDLSRTAIGDAVIIKDSNKTYVYEITEKRKVKPDDVDAILSEKNQLTLYTCDGTFDQRRLVVIALPKTDRLTKK